MHLIMKLPPHRHAPALRSNRVVEHAPGTASFKGILMLTALSPAYQPAPSAQTQRGVVLIIALIVLIVMTLGGIALIRSTDLTNIVAGNLAFKQAATHSGDAGIETAFNWLQANPGLLANDSAGAGYSANGNDPTRSPAAGQTWETYWNTLPAARIRTLRPADAAGNTVSFVIDRMCANPGTQSGGARCSTSTVTKPDEGSDMGAGTPGFTNTSATYYRITVRIEGPRNTISFVQAMVTL